MDSAPNGERVGPGSGAAGLPLPERPARIDSDRSRDARRSAIAVAGLGIAALGLLAIVGRALQRSSPSTAMAGKRLSSLRGTARGRGRAGRRAAAHGGCGASA